MEEDQLEPEPEAVPSRLRRPVTLRALLAAMALTAVLSVAGGVALSTVVLERGPAGPAGEEGEEGPEGPEGPAADEAEVEVDRRRSTARSRRTRPGSLRR